MGSISIICPAHNEARNIPLLYNEICRVMEPLDWDWHLIVVDDFSDACLFLMENYSDSSHLNVGSGVGITIRETAELVKEVVGFQGKVAFDLTRPDGAPKKLLDSTKMLSYGWEARTSIREGIERTYDWYLEQKD